MNAPTTLDAQAARLSIMLTELRLPTVRRLWEAIGAQSDREGWPCSKRWPADCRSRLIP